MGELCELVTAGVDVKTLKRVGYPVVALRDFFGAEVLVKSGYGVHEMQEAGFSANELAEAGYGAEALTRAGYSFLAVIDAICGVEVPNAMNAADSIFWTSWNKLSISIMVAKLFAIDAVRPYMDRMVLARCVALLVALGFLIAMVIGLHVLASLPMEA